MAEGYKVTLRPHPQTVKFAKAKIDNILKKYSRNKMFSYEANIAGQESLHISNVMISDWSGAALDYAFGLSKPVWFVDVPRKVNNLDYEELGIEPFEVMIREKIGVVLDMENIDFNFEKKMIDKSLLPFNINLSNQTGSEYILRKLINEN